MSINKEPSIDRLAGLKKEFLKSEINFRVGSTTQDKKKGKPLAYIDARAVMDRLDSVVGSENWQDRYEFIGDRTICYLSLRIDDEWITKADGAGDTTIEGEKGGISDALKRAAVKWGVGRYLYNWDFKWMPLNEYKQLEGNPWDFQIKQNQPQAPKNEDAHKLKNAEIWVDEYLKKIDGITIDTLMDLQITNAAMLNRITLAYPKLNEKIMKKTNEIRGV